MKNLTRSLLSPSFSSLGLALGLTALVLSSPSLQAQERCRLGIHYQMGSPMGWGKGYPVLTGVLPYSPASIAGLRAGDVITAIDGVSTSGRSSREVSELLVRPVAEHLITLERLGAGSATTLLRPYCKGAQTVTEAELAVAFAGYSQLDATTQQLSYPFTFRAQVNYPWEVVRTFAFAPSNSGNEAMDKPIYAEIAKLLEARGLKQVDTGAELIVETFYSLQPSQDSRRDATQPETSLRYEPQSRGLQVLPLLPSTSTAGSAYDLNLTLQVTPAGKPNQILWSCESKERLSEAMTLPTYAAGALPVMLQSFPYAPSSSPVSYHYQSLRYLYTGIVYDLRQMNRIADVVEGSPAFKAGLRSGDYIHSINGKPFSQTDLKRLSEAYQSFLGDTFRYRQTAELAPNLRPWEKKSYAAIRKALEKSPGESIFSYLFFFRPYVNDSEHTLLLLDIERDGKRYSLSIPPELRDETTLILD